MKRPVSPGVVKTKGIKSRGVRAKNHAASPPVSPIVIAEESDALDGRSPSSSAAADVKDDDPFAAWATQGGFGELVDKFRAAGYDTLDLLQELNESDVKTMLEEDMGVEKPGHRMKVVVAIRKLRAAVES